MQAAARGSFVVLTGAALIWTDAVTLPIALCS
jgi:hypothetical protein